MKPRLLGINLLVLERMLLGRTDSGLVEGHEFLRCEIRFLANSLVPFKFKWSPPALRGSFLMLEWGIVLQACCLANWFKILFTSLILLLRVWSDLEINDEIVILQSGEWFCIFNPRLMIPLQFLLSQRTWGCFLRGFLIGQLGQIWSNLFRCLRAGIIIVKVFYCIFVCICSILFTFLVFLFLRFHIAFFSPFATVSWFIADWRMCGVRVSMIFWTRENFL